MHFNLPDEIVGIIISFFGSAPLQRAACVCKAWQQASAEEFFRRGLSNAMKYNYDQSVANYTLSLKIFPTAKAFEKRGNSRYNLDDKEGAKADWSTALTFHTNELDMHITRSKILQLTDINAALDEINKAIAINPNYASCYFERAFVSEEIESAIVDYQKCIDLKIEHPYIAYNNMGNLKYIQGDHEGAIADLSLSISLNPSYKLAYTNRAKARAALNDMKGALEDASAAIAIIQNNKAKAFAYCDRALYYIEMGESDAALKDCYAAIAEDETISHAYTYAGAILGDQQRFDEALELIDRAIGHNPEDADLFLFRGELKSIIGQTENAIEDYCTALRLAKQKSIEKSALKKRAKAYEELCDYRSAVSDISTLITICESELAESMAEDSTSLSLAEKLSALSLNQQPATTTTTTTAEVNSQNNESNNTSNTSKPTTTATTAATAATATTATTATATPKPQRKRRRRESPEQLRTSLAFYYSERAFLRCKSGSVSVSIRDCETASELDPDNVYYYRLQAAMHSDIGQYEKAIDVLNKAISVAARANTRDARLYRMRGESRNAIGDLIGAVADLRESLRIDPTDAAAQELLNILQRRIALIHQS